MADKGIYPELKRIASAAGWKVNSIRERDLDKVSDEYIAMKYGKGKCVLLTHDKLAYKYNCDKGFIGYIVYEKIPSKYEFDKFLHTFKVIVNSHKSKDIKDNMLLLFVNRFEIKPLS